MISLTNIVPQPLCVVKGAALSLRSHDVVSRGFTSSGPKYERFRNPQVVLSYWKHLFRGTLSAKTRDFNIFSKLNTMVTRCVYFHLNFTCSMVYNCICTHASLPAPHRVEAITRKKLELHLGLYKWMQSLHLSGIFSEVHTYVELCASVQCSSFHIHHFYQDPALALTLAHDHVCGAIYLLISSR